jgi:hypothetical protein
MTSRSTPWPPRVGAEHSRRRDRPPIPTGGSLPRSQLRSLRRPANVAHRPGAWRRCALPTTLRLAAAMLGLPLLRRFTKLRFGVGAPATRTALRFGVSARRRGAPVTASKDHRYARSPPPDSTAGHHWPSRAPGLFAPARRHRTACLVGAVRSLAPARALARGGEHTGWLLDERHLLEHGATPTSGLHDACRGRSQYSHVRPY